MFISWVQGETSFLIIIIISLLLEILEQYVLFFCFHYETLNSYNQNGKKYNFQKILIINVYLGQYIQNSISHKKSIYYTSFSMILQKSLLLSIALSILNLCFPIQFPLLLYPCSSPLHIVSTLKHRASCMICQTQCKMIIWIFNQNPKNKLVLLSQILSSPVMEFSNLLLNNVLPLAQGYWWRQCTPQRPTGTLSTVPSNIQATSQNYALLHPQQQLGRNRGMQLQSCSREEERN